MSRGAGLAAGLLALALACAAGGAWSRPPDLLQLLAQRDFDAALKLVRAGADPNQSYPDGKTPLMVASKRGHAALVTALLDAGADVNVANANGGTALMFASIRADAATVAALLEAGAQVNPQGVNGWSALTVAAVKGHAPLVEELLRRGAAANAADVYGWTPLMRAAAAGRVRVLRSLIAHPDTDLQWRDDEGANALHRAAEAGQAQAVEVLAAAGIALRTVDAAGRSAARRAAAGGHRELAARLSALASRQP